MLAGSIGRASHRAPPAQSPSPRQIWRQIASALPSTQISPGKQLSYRSGVPALPTSQGSPRPRTHGCFEQPSDAAVEPVAPLFNAVHFSVVQHPVWQTGSQVAAAVGEQPAGACRATHASASDESVSVEGPSIWPWSEAAASMASTPASEACSAPASAGFWL
jgi:hypothetical protein